MNGLPAVLRLQATIGNRATAARLQSLPPRSQAPAAVPPPRPRALATSGRDVLWRTLRIAGNPVDAWPDPLPPEASAFLTGWTARSERDRVTGQLKTWQASEETTKRFGSWARAIVAAREQVSPGQPRFTRAFLDVVDVTSQLNENGRNALIVLGRAVPRSSAWKQLDWETVRGETAANLFNPSIVNQCDLGVCGPAAILNALAVQDPVSYVHQVISVFTNGIAGGKALSTSLLAGKPPGRMTQSDWMMLSSMQDSSNYIFSFKGEESSLRNGSDPGQAEDVLRRFGGYVNTKTLYTVFTPWNAVARANALLRGSNAQASAVLVACDADILKEERVRFSWANHFVRITAPIEVNEDEEPDRQVQFHAFTWGTDRRYGFSKATFARMVWAFVLGTRDRSVKL